MSSSVARTLVFCFPALLGCLPLAAQSSSYHLETDGKVQRLVLVNDSEKSIEAYEASQLCFKPRVYSGMPDASRDILNTPWGAGWGEIRAADGRWPVRSGVLEPGGRWYTEMASIPEKGDCRTEIHAVLFSDGSFEGEDAGVRGLKAKRDGIAAAIRHWADRISGEKPDGSTLEVLHDELRKSKAEHQMKRDEYRSQIALSFERVESPVPPEPMWMYWSGWLAVEWQFDFQLSRQLSQERAAEKLRKITDEINQWKTRVDGNLALQKLDKVFPAISESADWQ